MEANEISEKEGRKTISPEHIIAALKSLGFEDYIDEIQQVYNETQKSIRQERERRNSKLEHSGVTMEELKRKQEELFASARSQMQGPPSSGAAPGGSSGGGASLPVVPLSTAALPTAPLPAIHLPATLPPPPIAHLPQ
ncbi:hypothetical protein SeMB42_g07205 [Synchytrium endobioticum]|nr:hypothetical protein SeMB42_g07205 [Synchytrium endobioticum]